MSEKSSSCSKSERVEELVIAIRNGEVIFVYDDRLADLVKAGDFTVKRASHVEPDQVDGWLADMGPSGGPVLTGFALRSEALAAEKEWLNQNVLLLKE